MNTSVRNRTVGGRSIPLDPPRPPEKPHMLLWIDTEASQYVLHPAGTNVDYDIDILTNQLAPHLHPDWLRALANHRKLDLSTYRISDLALDHNPYQGHTGTHRVEDCITRDRNDYTTYLDRLIEHERNQQ